MLWCTWFIHDCFRFQILFRVKLFLRDLENQIVRWVEFAITLFPFFFHQIHLIVFSFILSQLHRSSFWKLKNASLVQSANLIIQMCPLKMPMFLAYLRGHRSPLARLDIYLLSYASNTLAYWLKFIWAPLSLCGAYMI